MRTKKIVVAVTGASGSIYAQQLIELLAQNVDVAEIALIFSPNGLKVWEFELGATPQAGGKITLFSYDNLFAAPASGSAQYHAMVVAPCSMGTLARIAHGTSDNLICRAADVMLKERRKLVLVVREAPYSLIHIDNMRSATMAGAVICPASPSFYSKPKTIDDAALTVTHRVMDLIGLQTDQRRWGDDDVAVQNPQ